jgi:hypothetical protein
VRIVLLILIPPLLLFACILMALWVPLPRPFPPPLSHTRNLVAAIAAGVLGIGYLGVLAAYTVWSFLQAGRALDPILMPMGFTSQSHGVFGRAYHGSFEGREVIIDYMPARAPGPAVLNIHFSAKIGTRMAIVERPPLLDCADCPRVTIGAPGLGDLQTYTQSEACAQSLLADPSIAAVISRLIGNGSGELYLQPNRVWFRSHPRELTGAQFEAWLEDLHVLAGTAEAILEPPGCTQ